MNPKDIVVKVVKYGDRKNLLLSYVNPRTGKRLTRSANTAVRREAERAALAWEAELREGSYNKSKNVSWEDFRERYERQVHQEHAAKTLDKVISVFNAVEQIAAPRRLADLDDQRLIYLKDELLRLSQPEYRLQLLGTPSRRLEYGLRVGHAPATAEDAQGQTGQGLQADAGQGGNANGV